MNFEVKLTPILLSHSHAEANPPPLLREWQDQNGLRIAGPKVWTKAVTSRECFRPNDADVMVDTVGEMELDGIFLATSTFMGPKRRLKLGAISVVTEIFDDLGRIVTRDTVKNKYRDLYVVHC